MYLRSRYLVPELLVLSVCGTLQFVGLIPAKLPWMLDHTLTIAGPHNTPPLAFALPSQTLLVYASGDTVVIVDGVSLAVTRILAFWEAFPATFGGDEVIRCIAINREAQMVVGSLGNKLVFWTIAAEDGTRWRVHSTLVVDEEVTTLDCKGGNLALGTRKNLSIFALNADNELCTWTKQWAARLMAPALVAFSPSGIHVACTSQADLTIRIFNTRSQCQTQSIRHPLPTVSLAWRSPLLDNPREDSVLFTSTSDGTTRVYMPVLDAPALLQLHATLDRFSFLPDPLLPPGGSPVFWLDRSILQVAIKGLLGNAPEGDKDERTAGQRLRLKQILDEGWDLFARVLQDGSLVIRAIANIDRRPPTLLRQFTVVHTPAKTFPSTPGSFASHLLLMQGPSAEDSSSITIATHEPLRSYRVSLPTIFDGDSACIQYLNRSWDPMLKTMRTDSQKLPVEQRIRKFIRTADGEAVGVLRDGGDLEIWRVTKRGKLNALGSIQGMGANASITCLFNGGRTAATWSHDAQTLVVYQFMEDKSPRNGKGYISQALNLHASELPCLFSLAQVDAGTPLVIATPSAIHLVLVKFQEASDTNELELSLHIQPTNPILLQSIPRLIIPVDPMVWLPAYPTHTEQITAATWKAERERDAFVTLSESGLLEFWVLSGVQVAAKGRDPPGLPSWRCTGVVHTGRTKIVMAQCSSAKKTVLVVDQESGQEVTIWDSKESEFSSGLEYCHTFGEKVCDLDWTSTNDSQSILALGFAQKVLMLCPQRMSYFDEAPTWSVLHTIDTDCLTPYSISDSIWLTGCSLLVGAGHQMFMFGETFRVPTPGTSKTPKEALFEQVARRNGPLPDFHPQLILQCLLWNKIELVKDIIVLLSSNMDAAVRGKGDDADLQRIPLWKFWDTEDSSKKPPMAGKSPQHFSFLFNGDTSHPDEDGDQGFSRPLVSHLLRTLEKTPIPHLTPSEVEHLIVLIQTTLEIDEQRRALDANGLRYLISIRSFFIINKRVAENPPSPTSLAKKGVLAPFVRERLRYRDIVWAFHSETQEILISASTAACGGKMMWLDARALGLFLWGTSNETLKSQMEIIARNQYMSGDARDPTACCLFYFALGKAKLVHGLWKQAAWHKEQSVMLKFLANDFTQVRWQTAALKNAFALLSKQRFEYAAAFFLLGGSLKDAVNVCLKQLQDFQLAVALARVVEGGDDGPVFQDILKNHVVPRAFREGNRWLGSWAFWMMHRRDLAVRILLTPLRTVASTLDVQPDEIGEAHYDDPSLAILFAQLKSKSLQTVKGTSEISGRTEFNFVMQMCRVLCRMGCHVLALDLVRSWSFDRPTIPISQLQPQDITEPLEERLQELGRSRELAIVSISPRSQDRSVSRSRPPPSPTMRKSFQLMRRASLIIDMDIPSLPPTEPTSPPEPSLGGLNGELSPGFAERGNREEEVYAPSRDDVTRQVGFGSLMKNAKKDVTVAEFDMSNFF